MQAATLVTTMTILFSMQHSQMLIASIMVRFQTTSTLLSTLSWSVLYVFTLKCRWHFCSKFRSNMPSPKLTTEISASAESIARVYNLALGITAPDIGNSSRLTHSLSEELVLDTFFLHGLLRDSDVRNQKLSLPHGGLQRHRFNQALDVRNNCMAGSGQEMWTHACNKCMHFYCGTDGHICKYANVQFL